MKLTPWFPVSIPPARNGYYEVRCTYDDIAFADGERRRCVHGRWAGVLPMVLAECDEWRGLAGAPERKSSLPAKRSIR